MISRPTSGRSSRPWSACISRSTPATPARAWPRSRRRFRGQTLERIADRDLGASLALLEHFTDHDTSLSGVSDEDQLGAVNLSSPDPGPDATVMTEGEVPIDGSAGRWNTYGEIARGGMGAILKGRDPDLGRDLAIKVLLDQHRDRPDWSAGSSRRPRSAVNSSTQASSRCMSWEAADERPFFTMKLVKGPTLADLLGRGGDTRATTGRGSSPSSSRCARRSPTRTLGASSTVTSSRRTSWSAASERCRSWTGAGQGFHRTRRDRVRRPPSRPSRRR